MSAWPLFQDVLRRIRAEKPQLLPSFQNYLAAAETVAVVDDSILVALYKLTLATEYAYVEPRGLVSIALARGELAALADLLYAIARPDYRFARSLLEAYPGFRFPLERVDGEVRNLVLSLSDPAAKGYETLADCLGYADCETCRFMLRQMAVVARHSPAIVPEFTRLYRERRSALPEPLLRLWIARGTGLMESERVDEGVRHLLLKSGEGRRMLGLEQVVLEEYKSVLKIYVASLAGKELAINGLELSMFRLKAPYTDGATLFLPPEIGWFAEEDLNRRAYSVIAALQAASLRMGSFGLDFEALSFRAELADRYGTLLPEIMANLRRQYAGAADSIRERNDGEIEAVFPNGRKLVLLETEHEKLFYSLPTPDFARELFCLVENARIEARLGGSYPGLKRDFDFLNAWLWRRRRSAPLASGDDAEHRGFFATLEAAIQLSLVGRWDERLGPLVVPACLEGLRRGLEDVRRAQATVQDSAAAMFSIYNLFFDRFRLALICKRYDIRESFGEVHKSQLFPEVVRSVRPEILKPDEDSGFVPEDGEAEEGKAVDLAALRGSRRGADDELRKAIGSGQVKVFRYPEYDHLRGGYLGNRCTLFESALPSRADDYYAQVLRRHARVCKRTRKRFLAMKPDEMELTRGWYEGSEINISDAVDYCTSLRRGETPDDKIYCRKVLSHRELAVAVLLDASNSTDVQVGGRSVIDIEKDSLAILASALDAIDDTFALFSFNSSGPNKVFFGVVKDFHERWDETAQGRMASIEPYESNRDGCAIRHATARLGRRPERTKLLLLLSDGIPADVDYGTQVGMEAGAYAIEDTRRAILEARERGIVPFCLTIDSRAKDYIARLYGRWRFALLDDVGRLPERLAQLYLRLTG